MDSIRAISRVEDGEVKLPDNILEAAGLKIGQVVELEIEETPKGRKRIIISAEGAEDISLEGWPNSG